MVKPLQYMLIYIYIYLSCYFVLTNTVFLNTTSGSRKPPEYLIFASHDKFKTIVKKSVDVSTCWVKNSEENLDEEVLVKEVTPL